MTLQDVTAELFYHGFEILEVRRETKDYELTMLEWAKRLDATKDEIVARWGDVTYRIFRLFLWGGTHTHRSRLFLRLSHLFTAISYLYQPCLNKNPRPAGRGVHSCLNTKSEFTNLVQGARTTSSMIFAHVIKWYNTPRHDNRSTSFPLTPRAGHI